MCVLQRSPHHTPFRLRKMKRSDNTKCSQRRGVLLNPFTLRSERTARRKHLASLCKAAHMCPSQPALLLLETETQTQTSLSTETLLGMATTWKPSTRMFSQQQHRQMDCGSQDHSPIGPKPWGRWVSDFRAVQAVQRLSAHLTTYHTPSPLWCGAAPRNQIRFLQ